MTTVIDLNPRPPVIDLTPPPTMDLAPSGTHYGPTTSYSGSDMLVHFLFPGTKAIMAGTASTVTYGTFREVRQVRTLGRVSNKGVTRGPRTVGGTLIFTVINQHIVHDIMQQLRESNSALYGRYDKIKTDELPPFDIIITMANEYGQSGRLVIYGVNLLTNDNTLSMEDLFTESVMTYIARDVEDLLDTTANLRSGNLDDYNINPSTQLYDESQPIGKFTIASPSSAVQVEQVRTMTAQILTKYSPQGAET